MGIHSCLFCPWVTNLNQTCYRSSMCQNKNTNLIKPLFGVFQSLLLYLLNMFSQLETDVLLHILPWLFQTHFQRCKAFVTWELRTAVIIVHPSSFRQSWLVVMMKCTKISQVYYKNNLNLTIMASSLTLWLGVFSHLWEGILPNTFQVSYWNNLLLHTWIITTKFNATLGSFTEDQTDKTIRGKR